MTLPLNREEMYTRQCVESQTASSGYAWNWWRVKVPLLNGGQWSPCLSIVRWT